MKKKGIDNNNLTKVTGGQEPQEFDWNNKTEYQTPEKDREGLLDPINN